jgi:hypothetical protein
MDRACMLDRLDIEICTGSGRGYATSPARTCFDIDFPSRFRKRQRSSVKSGSAVAFSLREEQCAKLGLAKSHGAFKHCIETGSSSLELEMTFRTSEVAVCRSSDSVRSSVRWRSR